VYDYVDGKVDWMAFGLPVEGDDGPFLGQQVSEVSTCGATGTVGAARLALDEGKAEVVIVTYGDAMAVGSVDADALEGLADDVPLLDVLRPVPSTVRPSVTVASVAEGGGSDRLVTTSDGRLLGRAVVGAADDGEGDDHEGHDNEGHDHGDAQLDLERYEAELSEVLLAMQERFAGREPSAEEVRGFLRERLLAEGKSPAEADQFLEQLGVAEEG